MNTTSGMLMKLNKNVIEGIFEKLAQKDILFQVEAELQFHLAWEIKQLFREKAEIRFEYPATELINFNDKTKYIPHIDLVVIIDGLLYPIEIKYLRGKLEFGNYVIKKEAALHAYKFVNDISRVELFAEKYKEEFGEGYAIVLSNNPSVYKEQLSKSNKIRYQDFQLREGGTISKGEIWFIEEARKKFKGLDNSVEVKKIDEQKYCILRNDYKIKWSKYKLRTSINKKNGLFKYMIIDIK